jgi:hypothetical protein
MEKIKEDNNILDKSNESRNKDRSVDLISNSVETGEGDGFIVHHPFLRIPFDT